MLKRIIIGITGASGVILGIRLLESLNKNDWETHLIITKTAEKIIELETSYKIKEIEKLSTKLYNNEDFFASIASGSFKTNGMIIIPCSMKTLGGIASGFTNNLLLRCGDISLKERRKLVLVVRETPLNLIHIENMEKVTRAGGMFLPAVLTFYSNPKTIDDMIDHLVGKVLDTFDIENELYRRWEGKV